MPNTGLIVTLPFRLTVLARSWWLGLTVVIVVPRGASPGVSAFAPAAPHADSAASTAASPPSRNSSRPRTPYPPPRTVHSLTRRNPDRSRLPPDRHRLRVGAPQRTRPPDEPADIDGQRRYQQGAHH